LLMINPNLEIQVSTYDLNNENTWEQAANFVTSKNIDSYVNCSGIQGTIKPSLELNISEIDMAMRINLYSSVYFTNFFTKNISPVKPLRIIHFSGGGAAKPRPYFLPYSLSKTSLIRFVENFSIENPNVYINAIAPGLLPSKMQTEILDSEIPHSSEDFIAASKVQKNIEIKNEKILQLCEFLLSSESDGISGRLISAHWDNWKEWPEHLDELINSDLYTVRRIIGKDRNVGWGDI